VTFGKTATASYAWSSPGKRTMIDNFLEETLATSTVGTDAAAAPCTAAPELDCEPHDAQITPAALSTAIQENPIRVMPLLLGVR
jgi:hypothetical protein